jgi:hypothetical protein
MKEHVLLFMLDIMLANSSFDVRGIFEGWFRIILTGILSKKENFRNPKVECPRNSQVVSFRVRGIKVDRSDGDTKPAQPRKRGVACRPAKGKLVGMTDSNAILTREHLFGRLSNPDFRR